MNEEMNEQQSNKYLEQVEIIQRNAFENNLANGVVRELSYQQALSIYLRSSQLSKEGSLHPNGISQREYDRQVEVCYAQRDQQTSAN